MSQQDTSGIKNRIISFLRIKGPSLPVHIAQEINMNTLFTSAFLSELLSEKKIKLSYMKVGSSPIYFLQDQETKLENFAHFLKSKEKDAFLLLKEKKFLKDSIQEPAIRVALRSIRDFAIPFKHNEEIYWKYLTASNNEFITPETIKQQKEIPKPEETKTSKPEEIESPIREKEIPKQTIIQEKPLITIKTKPQKRPKEKSNFVLKVLDFLKNKDIELLEEINFKKKEFEGIARINSDLGKIQFFVMAKDKKKVTETDITLATQKSHSNRKMILLISTGELDKKAKKALEKYNEIIRFLKI